MQIYKRQKSRSRQDQTLPSGNPNHHLRKLQGGGAFDTLRHWNGKHRKRMMEKVRLAEKEREGYVVI